MRVFTVGVRGSERITEKGGTRRGERRPWGTTAPIIFIASCAMAMSTARPSHADPLVFFEHTVVSEATASDGAESVFAADLDGDGDLDVLSASSFDDRIAWYENDGRTPPGFTHHLISDIANIARAVHAADIDGDGDIDPISVSEKDNRVAWYENDGGSPPQFTERIITVNIEPPGGPTTFADVDGPQSIVAADLDGDGDMDLATASYRDDKITWFANDGAADPTFTTNVIDEAAAGAMSIAAGDLDGDGAIDLAAAIWLEDQVAWYRNDGADPPSFTKMVVTSEAAFAAQAFIADIDGDLDMDLVSASHRDNKIAWYENDGTTSPTFTAKTISTNAIEAFSVFAADIDGDGDTDVLSASIGDDMIAWYENDGTESFTERVITRDLDGDPNNDVPGFADMPMFVFAADLDGDADLDVLSASREDDKIAWFENDDGAPPSFRAHSINATSDGPLTLYAIDLDGDSDLDLTVTSHLDDKVYWYENSGQFRPTFTSHTILTGADAAEALWADDIDGDGDNDILTGNVDDHRVIWHENLGGSPPQFVSRTIYYNARHCEGASIADLDGDGDMDLMTASSIDDKVAWYENDGGSPPTFEVHIVTERPNSFTEGIQTIRTADIDGDGDIDLTTASFFDNKIAWFENDGAPDPTFTPIAIDTNATRARSVWPVDLDQDGDIDLALAAFIGPTTLYWYENDGAPDPNFTRHELVSSTPNANWMWANDLDGDGDIDLIANSIGEQKVVWMDNDGNQNFTERVIGTNTDGAWSLFGGDLDGDGDTDIYQASFEDDKITWYENQLIAFRPILGVKAPWRFYR